LIIGWQRQGSAGLGSFLAIFLRQKKPERSEARRSPPGRPKKSFKNILDQSELMGTKQILSISIQEKKINQNVLEKSSMIEMSVRGIICCTKSNI